MAFAPEFELKFALKSAAMTLVMLATLSAAAPAAEWSMVSEESELAFAAFYEGEEAPGKFDSFDAALSFEPETGEGSLAVTVDLASVDMFSADINAEIVKPEWLDAVGAREAVFESTSIEAIGDGAYVARGTLSIKGFARDVEAPFRWREDGDRAVLEGETTVDRTTFGIGMGEWEEGPIGTAIAVRYTVLFERAE